MSQTSPGTAEAATATPSTRIDFRYLSEPDMVAAGVTDMAACVDTMEDMFRLLHSGDYRMAGSNNNSHGAMVVFPDDSPFPEMPANTDDRRFMAMPAYLGGSFRTAGVKWYGSNIDNRTKGLPRSILMFTLTDTDTGAPLAFMSANLLSAYRTGAVPGVGARHLARADARTVGIVGPGVMARTSLSAFVVARPGIDTVVVKGRSAAGLTAFTAWIAEEHPQITAVRVVDTIEEVVRAGDIVTFCTSGGQGDAGSYPTVRREWLRPGAFLSMPSACNIDDALCAPEVRKVVDNRGLYEAWAEELPAPAHSEIPIIGCKFFDLVGEGVLDRDDVEDLADIVAGARPGRRDDDEIVILSVGGMPVEDVAWGTAVYRRAVEAGIGTVLNLWERPVLA
ncbi:tyramine oxidase subunit B [Mycetocola reblochoni]|uniref:Ornithine cyclodeaminase n=2 Tax=Mycetocola reblochoni TaxID=331618 RepID=A0A1R4KAH0_9MICO|nr:tyramine oxidase subunit B [Mycetocola reblochoni]RLP71196.1 ornithine cyclodeaminase [Mycetocola reblochoni]SJN41248.1 Ornithine cyclodeaminase [Mycetocola reblochoni REB411]